MPADSKKQIRLVRERGYLNKDFRSFRAELVRYAKAYYPDRIQDFSEASLGGLFMDMASHVGDTMAFYLDHQFRELFSTTAVENENLENLIRDAGVKITGNSPAVVELQFAVELPAQKVGTTFEPVPSSIPKILQGTICAANNGTRFEIVDDIDFADRDSEGNFVADVVIGSTNADGSPATLILGRTVNAVSGFTKEETFIIPNIFVPFRTITLGSENVTQINSIVDSSGNEYYQVEALTQDTVFKLLPNPRSDNSLVDNLIELLPAPYRFTSQTDITTRLTKITFGGGQGSTFDNDAIPDPSDFALPLYGKRTVSRFSIDPNNLLNTQTLGIAPQNTTITVNYKYGGGLSHNVSAESIRTISTLLMTFPRNPSAALAASVRATTDVINLAPARGGENAPSLNELRSKVPAARNSQQRIVSKEDLLARVYTMPSNFGRVFRAGVRPNPVNPQATQLFIVSRDGDGNLTTSPDSLKDNLVVFLNQFRMIGDAIDILDAPIANIGVEFEVVTEPQVNRNIVIQNIISRLQTFFKQENFQIDQPIRISDVQNIIYNNNGVVNVERLRFKSLSSTVDGREYQGSSINIATNTIRGLLFPPPGGMFQVKYPNFDLIGSGI